MAQTPRRVEITVDVRPAEEPFVLFDPEKGEPHSLEEAVQIAVGAASACWENLGGAGVFDDQRALEVSEQLIAWLRGVMTSDKVDQVVLRGYREAIDRNRDTIHRLEDELDQARRTLTAIDSGWVPPRGLPAALHTVLNSVVQEYHRAKAKHGEMTLDGSGMTDTLRLAALMEEVGEAAAELTYDSQPDGVEGGQLARLIKELVQVANVAVTWASYLVPGEAVSADLGGEEPWIGVQAPLAEERPSEGRWGRLAQPTEAYEGGSTIRVPGGFVAVMVPRDRLAEVTAVLQS